jgi:hypothetical protein
MKTIKSVKATKNIEVGTVKRVGEKEADSEVRGGYWKYVPKSEWKGEKKVEEQPKVEKPVKEKKNAKNSK